MTTQFTIPVTKLKAADVFSGAEETRYYLCGVHLVRNAQGTLLEATDGHRLIRIKDESAGEDINVIIPSIIISRVKINKRAEDSVKVTIDGENVSLEYDGQTVTGQLIDGTFPDGDRVQPKPSKAAPREIVFNPSYLGDFAKVNKILHGTTCGGIKLVLANDASSPQRIVGKGYEAVLMPMRV